MSAQTFAANAKEAPDPCKTAHANPLLLTGYTCHMAVMHWAFMDLGDSQATANARLQAIVQGKCQPCRGGQGTHSSISAAWYGPQFCVGGDTLIANRAALHASVTIGDVLLTNNPAYPMHSMVVVGKNSIIGFKFVYIRGFNNVGTLGTGGRDQYDNSDRDIDKDNYWHTMGQETRFGQDFARGGYLYCISYANFIARAGVVRGNCNNGGGPWVYTGP